MPVSRCWRGCGKADRVRRLRAVLVVLAIAMSGAAFASDLAAFNRAIENAAESNRAAIEYIRRGNVDLAAIELEQSSQRWAEVVQRFGGDRPAEIADAQLYTTTLTTVSTQLVGADIMLKSGRPEAAAKALQDIERAVDQMRR